MRVSAFLDELEWALGILGATPELGPRYKGSSVPGVRRLLLQETQHHIYYVFDSARSQVIVLAVWSTRRGTGPPLG